MQVASTQKDLIKIHAHNFKASKFLATVICTIDNDVYRQLYSSSANDRT